MNPSDTTATMEINSEIYLQSAFEALDAFSIPGIGTFRKTYRGAFAPASSEQLLNPPQVDITFSPEETPSVSLEHYLTDRIFMPVEEAHQIIDRIRREMERGLSRKGAYEVKGVGHLCRRGDGSLYFELLPVEDNWLSEELYGLGPVPVATMPPAREAMPAVGKWPKVALRSGHWRSFLLIVLLFALGTLILNQSPLVKPRSSLAEGLYVRPASTLGRVAPAEETFAATASPMPEGDQPAEAASQPAPPAAVPAPAPVVSEEPAAPELLAEGSSLRTEGRSRGMPEGVSRGGEAPAGSLAVSDTPAPGEPHARVLPATVNYHLIAGSFSSQRAAQRFAGQMKAAGFDPIILFPAQGSSQAHRVSIFRNRERSRVEAYAEQLKAQGRPSGWVYEEYQRQ